MIRIPRRTLSALASVAVIASASLIGAGAVSATTYPWHSAVTPKPLGSWFAVAYNNKTWVAAGRNGDIAYSADAVTWHQVAVPTGSWQSLAYGKGIWVSLSSDNSIPGELTSVSGKLWTAHNAPSGTWSSLAYGNGLFVASSFDGDIMTSSDGLHWTKRVTGNGHDSFYATAFGNGRFVTVDGNQGDFAMSTDGVHWNISHAANPSDGWGGVAYGNGTFVAFDSSSSGLMATSVNGTVWSYHSYLATGSNWSGTFGCNEFFSVANARNTHVARYLFSSLGTSWSATPVTADPFANNWPAVGYGNGKFVAVDDSGPITWRAAQQPCKQNVPNPATNVRGTLSAGNLTVSWNAPSYGGVKPTSSYIVKVTSDGFLKRCYSATTTCSVSGLKANTLYSVVVTALNKAGFYSAPTDAVQVLSPATSNFAVNVLSPVRLAQQPSSAWITGAAPYWAVHVTVGSIHTTCNTNGFGQCVANFTVPTSGQQTVTANYTLNHLTHQATSAHFSSLVVSGINATYVTSDPIAVNFVGGVANAYASLSIQGVTTSTKLDGSGNGVVNATAPAIVGTGSATVNVYDDGVLLESVSINLTT